MAVKEKPQGLDKPIVGKIIKYGARLHVPVYRMTNGRIGSKWRIGAGWKKPVPTLLLDHVGRKSGNRFTTPLLYLEDGPRLVIVASQGGLPKNPQWFHNLVANPDTLVDLPGERRRPVRARVADPGERAALWPRLVDLYADFESYQAWTEREIPVVVLDPR
ncbi:nitroreductase family deazaflavin-dependent oxidoreductase [Nocardioides silvaticus]|uniref:Nitroreductase family deazaflavin-dependent oxidoreductase n=1 Tax=Nocardioides silvaticus TaxID=2201891 RepID=A0A316T9U1_9ACTN|nr:nitroreductase/quinone reductase family protein [Nocardioides silvaticus]PWN01073.1 nitroreductase family deazaflavin-dependent oxidoreductase [Nocardioides silvaticus]